MNEEFLESVFSKVQNPQRVTVNQLENKHYLIKSAENTNDTLDWFVVNGKEIEKALSEKDWSWCYVFETAPKQFPCIYMFFGDNISKEILEDELKEMMENMPADRNIYIEDIQFNSIDIDKYDNSITELEKELYRKAGDVFKVYEP